MKYNYRDLMEHITADEKDFTVIEIDSNRIALARDESWGGASNGRYFSLVVNGKTVITRCRKEIGLRKALEVLNAQ